MSSRNGRSGRLLAARAALLVAGLVVGLLVAEASVRLLGVDAGIHVIYRENFRLSDNPVLKYELQPGSPDGRFQINRAGMRDDEYSPNKPDDTYRIVVLGDSVGYGLTVAQDQAFPQQLERLLNAEAAGGTSQRRYEVLNLGVSGYNIEQIVERGRVLGVPYEPDLIIYAYSLNDPQTFSLELQGLSAMREKAQEVYTPKRSALRWLSHSRVFMLIWRAFQEPWTRPVKPARQSPDYLAVVSGRHADYFGALHSGEGWQRVQNGFSEFVEIREDAKSRPRILVAVLPMYLGPGPHYPLSALHQKILGEASRQGLETLDLAPAFIGKGANTGATEFNDPFHPSPAGHRRAAAGLLRWLQESGPRD